MIGFRTFRNGDPPHLAEIWRTRSGLRGYAQPMTTALLERWVLAKPYFEDAGLQVATDDGRPIGFAHAGFGPTDDEQDLSFELGASIMVIVRPHDAEAQIAADLIARSESYLRSRGAKVLYGGGVRPLDAFYLGLYGGSELPGILDSDAQHQSFFHAAGYREIDRTVVLHRELAGFRPPVDRQQIQLRRRTQFDYQCDPPFTHVVGGLHGWRFDAAGISTFDSSGHQARSAGNLGGYGNVQPHLGRSHGGHRECECG